MEEVLIDYPFLSYMLWVCVVLCAIGIGLEFRVLFGLESRDGLRRTFVYVTMLFFFHTGLLGRLFPEGFLVLMAGAATGILSFGLYYLIRSRISKEKY